MLLTTDQTSKKNWFQQHIIETGLGSLMVFILAIILIIWLFAGILFPFLVSLVIAYLLDDPLTRLERRNVSHLVAVNVIFCLFFGSFLLVLFILIPTLSDQLVRLIAALPDQLKPLGNYVVQLSQSYPEYISSERVEQLGQVVSENFSRIATATLGFSFSTLTNILMTLIYLILIPFFVYFLLKDKRLFLHWGAKFLPRKHHLIQTVWHDIHLQISNYIRGKALEMVIVSIVASIVYTLLGLNYAILFGVYMGLVCLLPYIGVVMVLIPLMIVSYLQWGWNLHALYVLVAFVVMDALDGNILAPLLFSEAMKLHPLGIIISVLFFGGLWGFWGLFFALPLAAVVKVLLDLRVARLRIISDVVVHPK